MRFFYRWRHRIFGILIFTFTVFAHACKLGESFDVFFGRESAVLSSGQQEQLASWTGKVLTNYPYHDSLLMVGSVERGEEGGETLRRQRELTVRLALIDMKFTKVEVDVYDLLPALPPRPLDGDGRNYNQSVGMDFIPGCPHRCQCQASWKDRKQRH